MKTSTTLLAGALLVSLGAVGGTAMQKLAAQEVEEPGYVPDSLTAVATIQLPAKLEGDWRQKAVILDLVGPVPDSGKAKLLGWCDNPRKPICLKEPPVK